MSPVAAYESKAYSESVWAELSDTTLLAAWKDVFSDTLPACEDKMLKTVEDVYKRQLVMCTIQCQGKYKQIDNRIDKRLKTEA